MAKENAMATTTSPTARVWLMTTVLGLAVAALPMLAGAQFRVASEERFFRVEWQTERAEGQPPAIVGFVSHSYLYPVQRVQLQVQVLDDAGQVTHEARGAMEDVPPGARRTFRVPLPATGSGYVVTVHSFEFGAPQSP
jgi:hypothetical protein